MSNEREFGRSNGLDADNGFHSTPTDPNSGTVTMFPKSPVSETISAFAPHDLEERFEQAILEANAFTYMGLLFGEDYSGEYVGQVYLGQRHDTGLLSIEQQKGIARVVDTFCDLASSVEDQLDVSLHLIEPRNNSPEWLPQELHRIAAHSRLQLLFERQL